MPFPEQAHLSHETETGERDLPYFAGEGAPVLAEVPLTSYIPTQPTAVFPKTQDLLKQAEPTGQFQFIFPYKYTT